MMATRTPLKPTTALLIGVVSASTAGPIIRAALTAGAPPLLAASLRLCVAALLLTVPGLIYARREYSALTRRQALAAIASGLLLAAHFATFIASFAYASVMTTVVLVSTTPLWIGIAAPIFLKEKASLRVWVGILGAMAGSSLIGLGDTQSATSGDALTGSALALAGAILGAGYFLIGRGLRDRLSLLAYVWPVYGTAGLTLATLLLIKSASGDFALASYPAGAYLWPVLLAILPQLVGHTALNHAYRHFSATIVALSALGEPVGATILAAIFFHETPGGMQIAGAALVLVAIAFGSWPQREQASTPT